MTRDDDPLSDLLEQITPEPPNILDIRDIAARVGGDLATDSATHWPAALGRWAPGVAAAVVVALVVSAVTVAISLSRDDVKPHGPSSSEHVVTTGVPSTQATKTTHDHDTPQTHLLGTVIGPWHATVRHVLYDGPVELAADGDALILNNGRSLLRIDPRSGRVLAGVQAGQLPWIAHRGVLLIQPELAGSARIVTIARRSADSLHSLSPFRIGFADSPASSPVAYAATASGSVLYVGVGRQILVLDPESGGVLHRLSIPDQQLHSLAVSPDGALLYAATQPSDGSSSPGQVYALDAHTGAVRWHVNEGGPVDVLGAVSAGVVVVSYGGMGAVAVLASSRDGTTPGNREVASFGGGWSADVASDAETAVVGSANLVCLDPRSGSISVEASTGDDFSPLTFVDGRLYAVMNRNSRPASFLVSLTPPPSC